MPFTQTRPSHPADHFLMRDASWRLYRTFVEENGDANVRITYTDGLMEIMSPLPLHERSKRLIGQMVEIMTFELNIRRASLGSTTYSDNTIEKGLEPDECYYIANEARVRGKNRIDLAIDPPPDLAIEIDDSYRAIKRESIYAAMKVPEVWRYDGQQIDCLVLNDTGTYDMVPYSKCFPFLPVPELKRYLDMIPEVDENTMLRAFLDWVRPLAR